MSRDIHPEIQSPFRKKKKFLGQLQTRNIETEEHCEGHKEAFAKMDPVFAEVQKT